MALPRELRLRDGRSVRLRVAVPEDAAAITEFVNTIGAESRFVLRDRATWTLEEEAATLRSADGRATRFIVAETQGAIRGMITLARGRWPKNAHVAELAMACHPDFRGVSLGSALLGEGIEWARSAGVEKLTLEVFASNEVAIALYRRMGFTEEARLRGQFRIDGQATDGLWMAQWLPHEKPTRTTSGND